MQDGLEESFDEGTGPWCFKCYRLSDNKNTVEPVPLRLIKPEGCYIIWTTFEQWFCIVEYYRQYLFYSLVDYRMTGHDKACR